LAKRVITDEVREKLKKAASRTRDDRYAPPAKMARAAAMWESGQFSMADIIEETGQSEDRVRAFFARNKIKRGLTAKENKQQMVELLKQEYQDDGIKRIKLFLDARMRDYTQCHAVTALIAREVANCEREGRKFSTILDDVKSLKLVLESLRLGYDSQYKALGIKEEEFQENLNEDNIPTLEITVASDEVLRAEQEEKFGKDIELELDDSDFDD
jgi:hypothetical protein